MFPPLPILSLLSLLAPLAFRPVSALSSLLISASFAARSKWDTDYWKYLLRALASYRCSCVWARFLLSDCRLRKLAMLDRTLLFRLQRPYQRKALSTAQKLDLLVDHYQWQLDAWPWGFTRNLYGGHDVTIAAIAGAEGRAYRLVLSRAGRNGKEGELTLKLMREETSLMLAAFTVHGRGDATALSIGCLQGHRDAAARDLLKQATRDMHGLRPSQALLVGLYAFAARHGIGHLLGVPNDAHIYQARHRTRARVKTDFDQLWTEAGANREGQHFRLPARLSRKPMEAVPSHKRAQYRRRYALEDALAAAIAAALP